MRRRQFEELVRRAVEEVADDWPDEKKEGWPVFVENLLSNNVDIQVRRQPTKRQLKSAGIGPDETLLGLYEGVPLTDRDGYNMVLPDVITIFQLPIEEMCSTEEEVMEEVRKTLVHEVAHHFSITDVELEAWGVA